MPSADHASPTAPSAARARAAASSPTTLYTFHLIPNAHLDPVWLWDWREGLNEGIITCRTILDLMDEDPDLTFIRGESAVYRHIERYDPATFRRIVKYVKAGRWDVVGGTVVQPDTNLPATETFARHFVRAQNYFARRFGKPVRVAWAADSFGHAAGLPEILAGAGITGFSFTRPHAGIVPIDEPAFWWEGPGGSRVMGYRPLVGWYGCEREEMVKRLDEYLAAAPKSKLKNVGCYFGLGNHGGGPTRRQLREVREWAAKHPEVKLVFSGLHRLFDALYKEVRASPKGERLLPIHRGEMNFTLRGCYSSVAKYKFAYRHAEALLNRAERTDAAISAMTETAPVDLAEAWDGLLFNSFHDILPGSSIERAMDEQIAWVGSVTHAAEAAELDALNRLASRVDTRVPVGEGDKPSAVALLVWNPHPQPFRGHVELESSLDYRPIWAYQGRDAEVPVEVRGPDHKPLPLQVVATEHSAMQGYPWRKRVVVPLSLPATGWGVVSMQYKEGAIVPQPKGPAPATAPRDGVLDNDIYTVEAHFGGRGIRVARRGEPLFGGEGMTAVTVEDPWGSWGGMAEEPDSLDLSQLRHTWAVANVDVLERGPERATMWVRMTGGNSRMDLTISLYRGRDAVDVAARVLWDERSARLKLVMPPYDPGEPPGTAVLAKTRAGAGFNRAEFDVPGGSVTRGPAGEVPGGRWARVYRDTGDPKAAAETTGADAFGFASDGLYNFDLKDGAFRATVVRASRYANDVHTPPEKDPWRPAVDCGELKFKFLITTAGRELPLLARQLEEPPVAVHVSSKDGELPRSGSLLALAPASVKLLALKPTENGDGWVLRLHETAGSAARPKLKWLGKPVALGRVEGHTIATFRLTQSASGAWKARRVATTEL